MTNTTTADIINPFAPITAYKPIPRTRNPFHSKFTFWNIDTQGDFMCDGGKANVLGGYIGKLAVKDAYEIIPNLASLTAVAEYRSVQVVNTADWHNKNSAELARNPDFINTYPEHGLQHTVGAQFIEATRPRFPTYIDWEPTKTKFVGDYLRGQRNIVILKDKFDVFAGNKYAADITNLVMENNEGNRKMAVVYGVAANVCVDYAVMGLRERGYQVAVPTDAIKHLPHLETNPTMNLDAILKKWENAGVILTTTAAIEKIQDA